MAWIQSHSTLERHLKVVCLMTGLRWSKNETIGFLHRFWWTVLEVSPTGDVTALSLPEVLAEVLSMKPEICQKAWEKMIELNFIEKRGDKFFVHDWLDYVNRYLSESKYKNSPEKLDEIFKNYGRSRDKEKHVKQSSEDNPRIILGQSKVDKIREDKIREDFKREESDLSDAPPKNPESVKLAQELYDRILSINRNFKAPNLNAWAKVFDLMQRIDSRIPEQIRYLVDWLFCSKTKDALFWQKNILSPGKLREHFDRLILLIKDQNGTRKTRDMEIMEAINKIDEEAKANADCV